MRRPPTSPVHSLPFPSKARPGPTSWLLWGFLALGCAGGKPPPRFSIGHCTAAQVELQRAEMSAQVIPAVSRCVVEGHPEDCPLADAATERWLRERDACR